MEKNNNNELASTVDKLTNRISLLESEKEQLMEELNRREKVEQTLLEENKQKTKVISLLVARLSSVDSEFDSWSSSQQLF